MYVYIIIIMIILFVLNKPIRKQIYDTYTIRNLIILIKRRVGK